MADPPTPDSLGARLAKLRPVAHALNDPYFDVAFRPVDASWIHAGITKASGGFNPSRHTFYAARRSLFADWVAAPDGFVCPEDRQRELALEVMLFAHDYLHSWAYRLIQELYPAFRITTPETLEQLEEQAFFLVLTETAAVVGVDYWYLSLKGIKQRCGTAFDLGPLTISYYEKHLQTYRKADPDLTVRAPDFFERIFCLYGTGEFHGFSQEDLSENPVLADWMTGELRISTHQRNLSLNWLAYLGGLDIDATIRARKFRDLSERHADLVAELGRRLWRKIRYGQTDFIPVDEKADHWRLRDGASVDCRYANLNQAGSRAIALHDDDPNFWSLYVDQTLSGRKLPDDPKQRTDIAEKVAAIRKTREGLAALADSLEPVGGPDPAPLELLFVY